MVVVGVAPTAKGSTLTAYRGLVHTSSDTLRATGSFFLSWLFPSRDEFEPDKFESEKFESRPSTCLVRTSFPNQRK
eukprot:scaffold82903_cov67-Phaeocystis_antarctica.AAC.6